MKSIAVAVVLSVVALSASAQEFGRVVSATPVLQQVLTPRQSCTVEKVLVSGRKSGTGAAVGAIAGGVAGNALGGGGRGGAAATVLGWSAVLFWVIALRKRAPRTCRMCRDAACKTWSKTGWLRTP